VGSLDWAATRGGWASCWGWPVPDGLSYATTTLVVLSSAVPAARGTDRRLQVLVTLGVAVGAGVGGRHWLCRWPSVTVGLPGFGLSTLWPWAPPWWDSFSPSPCRAGCP